MKRLALVLGVLTLAVPSGAQAKGMTTIAICGQDGCMTLSDQAAHIMSPQETVEAPPPVAAFYRLEISHEAGAQLAGYSAYFVPSEGLIATNVGADRALLWQVPSTEALQRLRPAIRELSAFDAPASWPLGIEARAKLSPDPGSPLPYVLLGGALLLLLPAIAIVYRLRFRELRTA